MALNRSVVLVITVIQVLWAAAAVAQTSNWMSMTGVATAPGKIKRSIIDITKPGYIEAVGRRRGLDPVPSSTRATTVFSVPIQTGQTPAIVCHNYLDSATVALAPLGYAVRYVSNAPIPSTVEVVKVIGSFTVIDSISSPGMVFSTKFVPLNNGPALSPGWAEALVGLLAAAALLILRRRRLQPAKVRGR